MGEKNRLLTLLLIYTITLIIVQLMSYVEWWNPAPKDGSAPNLVIVAQDDTGASYYKRAFNTEVQYGLYLI